MSNVESPNITLKFEGLYEVLVNLCSFLDQENEALEKHDIEKVSETLNVKQKLAKLYVEMLRGVASNPIHIANLDEERRSIFKDMALKLSEKMKVNKHLLKANMEANKKVIKAIVNSANNEMQKESHAYSASGSLGGPKKNGRDTAFAFNQTL
ncbi:MAG: hypothetical protein AB7U85_09325 [Alphaproteobacteria bacterium]